MKEEDIINTITNTIRLLELNILHYRQEQNSEKLVRVNILLLNTINTLDKIIKNEEVMSSSI